MAASLPLGVAAARGGGFLIEERALHEVFTPEDFTEEQRMIARAAEDFMETEMVPRLPEILALKLEAPIGQLPRPKRACPSFVLAVPDVDGSFFSHAGAQD